MNHDAERVLARGQWRLPAENLHGIWQYQFLGDLRQRIVVAADEDADTGLVEAPELLGGKASRLHGGLVAVIKIAGDQQGVNLLVQAKVDHADECASGGIADQLRQLGVSIGVKF